MYREGVALEALDAPLAPSRAAPTVDDARLAAAAAAEHPLVEQVFVFGSVARGEASERSDIDLLVLLGDVTQEEWGGAWFDIRSAVQSVTDIPTDVTVQPRADFEHLSTRVTASFEHAASADAMLLYQSSPVLPPLGKLNNVPRDNLALAAEQARAAKRYLLSLLGTIDSIPASETRAAAASSGNDSLIENARADRYLDLLEAAHMVIEQSFRSATSASEGLSLGSSHEVDKYLEIVGDTPERAALEAAVDPLRGHGGSLRCWRLASYTGHLAEWEAETTAENASTHIRAAIACAGVAADAIESRAGGDAALLEAVSEVRGALSALERSPHSPADITDGPRAAAKGSRSGLRRLLGGGRRKQGRQQPHEAHAAKPAAGLLQTIEVAPSTPSGGSAATSICGHETPTGPCKNPKPSPTGRCAAGHQR